MYKATSLLNVPLCFSSQIARPISSLTGWLHLSSQRLTHKLLHLCTTRRDIVLIESLRLCNVHKRFQTSYRLRKTCLATARIEASERSMPQRELGLECTRTGSMSASWESLQTFRRNATIRKCNFFFSEAAITKKANFILSYILCSNVLRIVTIDAIDRKNHCCS